MFFKYSAFSKDGKKIAGTVQADTLESAVSIVESHGLDIISVNKRLFMFHRKFSNFDLFLMFDFLGKFLSNGLTLDKALEMIGNCGIQTSQVCLEMKSLILKGASFSESLQMFNYKFHKNSLGVLSIVDKVGSLNNFCVFLANHYKKLDVRGKKIKSSLRYPIILSFFFFVSFSVIVIILIPHIINLLTDMGTKPPLILRALNMISRHYLIYLFSVFSFTVSFTVLSKKFNGISNKIPIIKKYRFVRDFSFFFYANYMLLSNNVRLINSFKITKNCMYSSANIHMVEKICENIESGCSVSQSFNLESKDTLLNKMIELYEKSANLDTGFQAISEIYESEMFRTLDVISEYAQPVILSVLAFFIGIIVYSMLIPLYSSFS